MPDPLPIHPVSGPVRGTIRPPGSKSITNRALVCAALAKGTSTLTGALRSEDTEVMIACLAALGIECIVRRDGTEIEVIGCGGNLPVGDARLFVKNSGTTLRFLAPLVTIGQGTFHLDGIPRMRERPIGDLLDALRQVGVDIDAQSPGRCPPVVVRASGLRGGDVTIAGDVSSQFLSGLLMAAPYAQTPVNLAVQGPLVSTPYVTMTRAVMHSFGVDVTCDSSERRFRVAAPQGYRAGDYEIEPDASAASYFWAAAAITGGKVTVDGLSRDSLQGDVAFCDCLTRMGCEVVEGEDSITVCGRSLEGIDVDMSAISDTVQTLAAVALYADGPTTIRGVGHIRHKETDRIGDLAAELRKLGATVETSTDGLTITPGNRQAAEIETYNDHRMAMSLALVGLRTPGVTIRNPGCTEKTYPNFFRDLDQLTTGS